MNPQAGPDADEPIDPAIARFAEALQQGYAAYPDLDQRPLPERRVIAEAVRAPWREGGPSMARIADEVVATSAGPVRVRFFEPDARPGPRPCLIYAHGGGFTSFSLETHDRLMREYAGRAGVVVAGVDYALSPEAKFPLALNQVVGVVEALASDPRFGKLAVGGDSAGANLALSSAISLREAGKGGAISALVLNYGFFDLDLSTASQLRHGGPDKLLTRDELTWFMDNYIGGTEHGEHPLVQPMRADLHGLPPSFHVIAQCDPLADSDRAMADKLRQASGGVEAHVYPGATHSFLEAVSIAPLADQALAQTARWLAQRLA